jgi:hypothetical protein
MNRLDEELRIKSPTALSPTWRSLDDSSLSRSENTVSPADDRSTPTAQVKNNNKIGFSSILLYEQSQKQHLIFVIHRDLIANVFIKIQTAIIYELGTINSQ